MAKAKNTKAVKTVKQLEREKRSIQRRERQAPLDRFDSERLVAIDAEIARLQASQPPGPWLAREYANDEGGVWIDCDAWTGGGAAVAGTLATAHKSGTGDGNVGANARLIAAARELLAALEALVAITWNDGPLPDLYRKEGEAAERSIAKARAPWTDRSRHAGK